MQVRVGPFWIECGVRLMAANSLKSILSPVDAGDKPGRSVYRGGKLVRSSSPVPCLSSPAPNLGCLPS